MIGWRIQCIEAMIFVLDFRAIGDHKPDLTKAADDVFGDLGQRMQPTDWPPSSRQRKVDGLLWQRRLQLQLALAIVQDRLQFRLGLIDELACGWTFFFGEASQLLEQRGEFSVSAEVGDLRLFERSE